MSMLASQAVRNEQMAPIMYPMPGRDIVFHRANADASWLDIINENRVDAVAEVWQRENARAEWRKMHEVSIPAGGRVYARIDRVAPGTSGHVLIESSILEGVSVALMHAAGTVRGLGFDDPMNTEWLVTI